MCRLVRSSDAINATRSSASSAAAKPCLCGRLLRHFALCLKATSSRWLTRFESGFRRSLIILKESISHVASAAHHNKVSNVSGMRTPMKAITGNPSSVADLNPRDKSS